MMIALALSPLQKVQQRADRGLSLPALQHHRVLADRLVQVAGHDPAGTLGDLAVPP
jgi:hypothetical protein